MDYGRVSVRKIVEFVLRRGDIDSRHTSNHTALEGARIHRKLQKAAGEAYEKEVSLKRQFTLENEDTLTIEGRADGIFTKDEQVIVIDELKLEVYF